MIYLNSNLTGLWIITICLDIFPKSFLRCRIYIFCMYLLLFNWKNCNIFPVFCFSVQRHACNNNKIMNCFFYAVSLITIISVAHPSLLHMQISPRYWNCEFSFTHLTSTHFTNFNFLLLCKNFMLLSLFKIL